MQVAVTFRHMESTEALKACANEKIGKVTKYLPKATSAHVIMSVEKLEHRAEVLIDAGGIHVRAEARTNDMYRSIDDAMDKIVRQVKRYQQKIHDHKAKHAPHEIPVMHHIFALPTEEARQRDHIVSTKQIMAREMSVDDAVMQMDLLDNDFLVFQNVDSKQVNVLYRRDGKHFGLIEAQTPSDIRAVKSA